MRTGDSIEIVTSSLIVLKFRDFSVLSRASDFKMVARQLFEVLVVSLEPLTYEELLEVIRLGSPHKVSAMDLRAALSCLCSQSSAMIRAAKVLQSTPRSPSPRLTIHVTV